MPSDTPDLAAKLDALIEGATPGPWRIWFPLSFSVNGASILGDTGLVIATVSRKADKPYDQKCADAKLLASSRLLAAVARDAAHARNLERAGGFKSMEAWHTEATKRYAALDASLAALAKEIDNG